MPNAVFFSIIKVASANIHSCTADLARFLQTSL